VTIAWGGTVSDDKADEAITRVASSAGPLLGAIEGGGTKFVCAVGYSPDRILERVVIPTRAPDSTLGAMLDFFGAAERRSGRISAFGMASFGPLDLRRGSPTFGRLMSTPKPGWSGTDLIGALQGRFGAVPVELDTDVAGAALAELSLGAGRDVTSLAYVTVGTGIGGGFAPRAREVRHLLHPELGHLRVRRDPRDVDFEGICPFHGDCLEGLASGPAIRARWSNDLNGLELSHPAWSIIGGYLGQLATCIALMASPERIVLGGGVMSNAPLLPHIRAVTRALLNGYLEPLNDAGTLDRYICRPGLGDHAGLAGAFLLAAQANQQPE
jgi:fructokinase